MEVINPATEEVVATVASGGKDDVDAAVAAARAALTGPWGKMSARDRGRLVSKLADRLMEKADDVARLETLHNGKPIFESRQIEIPAAAKCFEYYAGWADKVMGETIPVDGNYLTYTLREPLGVVAAIVPWNVPQFVTMSKLAPALIAGCTIIVKPSPETPLDAFKLAELLEQAGIPKGVVSIIPAGREVGEHLVAHPGIDKVAFTGSTAAGRKIASICGEQLKRVSLELGGKSAAIVLDDADLTATMEGLRFTALMNSGQACVAQTRILASRAKYDEVVDALAQTVGSMTVGDPADPATEIGPMVAQRQQERVEKYIALGQEEGARLVLGGNGMPDGCDRGWYVRPTVFADVDNSMRIAQEEIFGPVLSVIAYDDVDDAVRIANDSAYGLAGTVWTTDQEAGLEVARQVRTGTYGVNTYTMDFAAPFGGYKTSGIGREFGPEGLAQYVEHKSIYPTAPAG
jgi:betaine-aldehyde dehydrogenase